MLFKLFQLVEKEHEFFFPISVLKQMSTKSLIIFHGVLIRIFYELYNLDMEYNYMFDIEKFLFSDIILNDLVKILYLHKSCAVKGKMRNKWLFKIMTMMNGFYYKSLSFHLNTDGTYYHKHINFLE